MASIKPVLDGDTVGLGICFSCVGVIRSGLVENTDKKAGAWTHCMSIMNEYTRRQHEIYIWLRETQRIIHKPDAGATVFVEGYVNVAVGLKNNILVATRIVEIIDTFRAEKSKRSLYPYPYVPVLFAKPGVKAMILKRVKIKTMVEDWLKENYGEERCCDGEER